MDEKKSNRFYLFFSDIDHKLYLTDQKNTYWDHFFSEEGLSEEQLIRKYGKNGGRNYSKKSDQKNS